MFPAILLEADPYSNLYSAHCVRTPWNCNTRVRDYGGQRRHVVIRALTSCSAPAGVWSDLFQIHLMPRLMCIVSPPGGRPRLYHYITSLAACHVRDDAMTKGVHLALMGGLTASISIAAVLRNQCSEAEAAAFHDSRVGTSYTRWVF